MKTVERPQITPELAAHLPRPGTAIPGKIRYSPDSKYVTYLFSERGDLFRDLWRLELSTGKKEHWLEPPGEAVTEETVSREEALRRERLRLRETGITDYQWAEKANVLLLPLRGELFKWADGHTGNLTGAGVIDPKVTPNGRRIFFVRDGDVWAIDEGGERRLTFHPPGATNGLAEFVAQEELSRMSGYWPTEDGGLVAFEQVDESHIPIYPIVHQGKPALEIEEHRYPFAGAENARVKLGVVSVETGRTTFMDLGVEDGYVARVDWHPDGRLFVQWLSRDWQHLELRAYDINTGGGRPIVVEKQGPWINLHDDLRFVEDTGEFVWASERTGYQHLYLYAPDGRLIRQLTSGAWPAEATVALDDKRRQLYFVGWQESPLERHLFRVSLDGGPPERLTSQPGMHGVVIAPDFSSFVDVWDSRSSPPSVTVRSMAGAEQSVIHAPAEVDLDLTPPQLHRFRTSDGAELYAAIYKPSNSLPLVGRAGEGAGKRAPVIVEVYGGPHFQMVQDSWGQTVDLRAQMLAQHGFVVLKVDNRGSSRRGLGFEAPIARNLGDVELRDQIEGVRWLGTLGFADISRVGITGWSYGGYMTLMALLKAPEVFKVGVAGAPVTFYEGYDTAYTEKFLSTPQANPDGYRRASPLTHADRLSGRLLLIHGMIDENVHFRHTARMMQALIDAGKSFETLIYPNERHGPRSERDRADMERIILDFFKKNL
ncbi:MAG TPA: DPP IV N-terminal domain-containing protein [Candidatus Dormibacteraeota bacterium]|nr:DPP IV N-terminal domain-containing protein [Candidatus Dormibacteraeota bacterium]